MKLIYTHTHIHTIRLPKSRIILNPTSSLCHLMFNAYATESKDYPGSVGIFHSMDF